MARALILDYNGVIVNDEPIHLRAYQEVFAPAGIVVSRDEYFTRYLGVPDREVVRDALRRRAGREATQEGPAFEDEIDHLLALKAMRYRELVRRDLPEVPGAVEFILRAAERYPIAVASGSIRVEVEDGLYRLGVRDAVTAVVTIEDVTRGKPDPEIFLTARAALLRICSVPGAARALDSREPAASFAVVEDSPAGLAAARAAWMPAVGLTTSRPAEDLKPAALVASDLASLSLETLAAL